jgi:phosphate transport system substrate-binding protein
VHCGLSYPTWVAFRAATRGFRSRSQVRVVCLVLVLGLIRLQTLAEDQIAIVGSGSSVPAPLYKQWAEEYQRLHPAIQVQYLALGTSEGIRQMSRGVGDFGAGEVPLTAKERREGSLIELPVMLIGIVPIYNLPDLDRDLRFSGELLADIYLGRVKTWNSLEIARLNPGVALPNLPISVIYRPAGKGSNYVFTDFLSKTSSRFRTQIGPSPSPAWPVGAPAERSSDMVDKVKQAPGAIGYVELQFAMHAYVRYGLVLNPSGKFVKASAQTVMAACNAVENPGWDKYSVSLTNVPGADSFPITSFTWLYVRTNLAKDPKRSAALLNLINWMLSDGQNIGARLGYASLPETLRFKTKALVDSLH